MLKPELSLFLCLIADFIVAIVSYEVPVPIIEPLSPRGFKVSIPDDDGITLMAFHGFINKDGFENGREAGDIAVDVLRKKEGRWTYTNRDVLLKNGDIIYYWLYVIKNGLGYERLFQSYTVNGGFQPTPTPTPMLTPTPPTPTPTPQQPDDCIKSATTVNGVQQCSGKVLFKSEFYQGNLQNWNHVVQVGKEESEFVVFDSDSQNTFIEHEKTIVIKPTLLDDKYHNGFTTNDKLDLGNRCTSNVELECISEPLGRVILPPVLSARLITERSFSFRYGIVEVTAKLPRGDWVVPEIWLLPKTLRYGSEKSGKIILASSNGNEQLTGNNGKENGNKKVYCGLNVGNTRIHFDKTLNSGLWSDNMHKFKMIWEPDQITFYIDDNEVGRWNSRADAPLIDNQPSKIAPFDQEFYLVIGVHVGGPQDFSNCQNSNGHKKPWKDNEVARRKNFYDDRNNWKQTWDDRTALRIEDIKVLALKA